MRKIILSIPITLDGYIEGPHRELNWVIADDDLHDFYSDLLASADLLIFGRVAYQLMADFWPNAPSDPSLSPGELRFANTLNPMRKIVYSKTLENVGWNTTIIKNLVPEEIMAIKAQPGKNILLSGGASIAQAFQQYGLVDEYQLMVQPVVIGNGNHLFAKVDGILKMNYCWSRSFGSGAVVLCYQPIGKN